MIDTPILCICACLFDGTPMLRVARAQGGRQCCSPFILPGGCWEFTCQPAIMFNSDDTSEQDPAHVESIYHRAPVGALTIAGIATAVVFALWLAFYLVIFLPRGVFQ